jgi:hypothetical protein
MAGQLGCPRDEVAVIELAARLHCLEMLGAADLRSIRSLRGAALIVEQHRTAASPEDGSLGAQIVAVADAYDTLLGGPTGKRRGRAAAVAELRAGIGPRFRADVVEALATVVAARRDPGHRRRQADTPVRVQGAA